jgi:hypothetical protein
MRRWSDGSPAGRDGRGAGLYEQFYRLAEGGSRFVRPGRVEAGIIEETVGARVARRF